MKPNFILGSQFLLIKNTVINVARESNDKQESNQIYSYHSSCSHKKQNNSEKTWHIQSIWMTVLTQFISIWPTDVITRNTISEGHFS